MTSGRVIEKKMKRVFLYGFVLVSLSSVEAENLVDTKSSSTGSDFEELIRSHNGKIEELEHRVKMIEQNLGISHSEKVPSKTPEQIADEIKEKSPGEVIEMANDLIKLDKGRDARDILNTFIEDHPKSIHCGKMYFYIGKSYFEEKDYQNAAKAYMKCFEINSGGDKTPKALFRLSDCFLKLGKQSQRIITLEKLASTFPQLKYGQKAAKRLKELKKS